jgi:drug/metabolite transporter (DMT)-like permease
MVLIWGTNFSIAKYAFREMNPQAFNAVRMVIASGIFLSLMKWMPHRSASDIFYTPERITRSDWRAIALLGIVGHFFYQYFFVGGLALTTVANSSLMLAATPVIIAILSALLGHDRPTRWHWIGAALSLSGIYFVVGHGMSLGSSTLRGDLMMLGGVVCWATYTLGTRRLMERHSPVGVTGLTMAIGTMIYVPVMLPHLLKTDWSVISWSTWIALIYSAVFALVVSYTIWYVAVREIGSARTAVYSNVVPIVAMLTAIVFLGERLTASKALGAACVLIGVALTRIGSRSPTIPAGE